MKRGTCLVAVFLLLVLASPVAAQASPYESPWQIVLGLLSAFMAVISSVTAVLVLPLYPQTFGMLHLLAFVLLLISYSVSEFSSPVLPVAVLATVMVIVILIATALARNVAGKIR